MHLNPKVFCGRILWDDLDLDDSTKIQVTHQNGGMSQISGPGCSRSGIKIRLEEA